MAAIDVGNGSGRRELQRDLPLVPFIDFLLCIVAFLLVTAVWSQMARLEADALVPGDSTKPAPSMAPLELHIEWNGEQRFQLVWRRGATVVAKESVEAPPLVSSGVVSYPMLAQAIARSWRANGAHKAVGDPERDRAIVHASNTAPFEYLVAVMDAVSAIKRAPGSASGPTASAFQVAFATD